MLIMEAFQNNDLTEATQLSLCAALDYIATTSLTPGADLNSWKKLCSGTWFSLNRFPSLLLTSLLKGNVPLRVHPSPKIPQGWGRGTYDSLDRMRVESRNR